MRRQKREGGGEQSAGTLKLLLAAYSPWWRWRTSVRMTPSAYLQSINSFMWDYTKVICLYPRYQPAVLSNLHLNQRSDARYFSSEEKIFTEHRLRSEIEKPWCSSPATSRRRARLDKARQGSGKCRSETMQPQHWRRGPITVHTMRPGAAKLGPSLKSD